MKKLLVILLALMMLFGCTKKPEPVVVPDQPDACGDEGCEIEPGENTAYQEILSMSNFVKSSYEEIATKFKNGGSFTALYGFEGCPWCEELLPILGNYLKGKNYKVYYVDVKPDGEDTRTEDNETYMSNYEIFRSFTTDKIYVPAFVNVVNGEVVSYHEGTVDGHDATERKMTEEEKAQLLNLFKETFGDTDDGRK
ncbi:MAG: hypothetical protein IIZ11_02575 [Erysipelotrichaceae bacterium]|nr:hypothetical protein [Erysipelotrichaceae bacterium]